LTDNEIQNNSKLSLREIICVCHVINKSGIYIYIYNRSVRKDLDDVRGQEVGEEEDGGQGEDPQPSLQ